PISRSAACPAPGPPPNSWKPPGSPPATSSRPPTTSSVPDTHREPGSTHGPALAGGGTRHGRPGAGPVGVGATAYPAVPDAVDRVAGQQRGHLDADRGRPVAGGPRRPRGHPGLARPDRLHAAC